MRKLPTHTFKLLLMIFGAILMLPSLRAQIEIKNDHNMHPDLMAKPEVMVTELGLQLLNYLDSCSLDTLRVTETYSDAMDVAVTPAADTIEWRYIATTLADLDSMYPDSAWEYGSAFDTCCFRIGGLEQLTTYIIQARIWCVDSAKYTPWTVFGIHLFRPGFFDFTEGQGKSFHPLPGNGYCKKKGQPPQSM